MGQAIKGPALQPDLLQRRLPEFWKPASGGRAAIDASRFPTKSGYRQARWRLLLLTRLARLRSSRQALARRGGRRAAQFNPCQYRDENNHRKCKPDASSTAAGQRRDGLIRVSVGVIGQSCGLAILGRQARCRGTDTGPNRRGWAVVGRATHRRVRRRCNNDFSFKLFRHKKSPVRREPHRAFGLLSQPWYNSIGVARTKRMSR
jgi:hypothetical protein